MKYLILEGLMFGTRFVIPEIPFPERGNDATTCFKVIGSAETMEEAVAIMNSLPVNTETVSENKT